MKRYLKRNNIVFLLMFVSLTSFDCYQQVSVRIIDKETGKPVQGVTIYKKNESSTNFITDSTGNFELRDISGGLRCPPMTVIIENTNYKSCKKRIPSGGYKVIKLRNK